MAECAGPDLPDKDDVIYFEIPEAIGQIASTRTEVHLFRVRHASRHAGPGTEPVTHPARLGPVLQVRAPVQHAVPEAVVGRTLAGHAVAVHGAGREPQEGRRLGRAQIRVAVIIHAGLSLCCRLMCGPVRRRPRRGVEERRPGDRAAHGAKPRLAGRPRHPAPDPADRREPEPRAAAQPNRPETIVMCT